MFYVVAVVEDEQDIRAMVAEFLQDAGFKVIEAHHAAHAIEVILAAVSIDLVFTDIHMPPGKMSGHDLADWLHTHRPGVPVLLTSGVDRPQLGAGKHRRFIAKPYALPEVERHIREMLH